MSRFLTGMITGGVVSAAALGLLSQMTIDRQGMLTPVEGTSAEEETSSSLASGPAPTQPDAQSTEDNQTATTSDDDSTSAQPDPTPAETTTESPDDATNTAQSGTDTDQTQDDQTETEAESPTDAGDQTAAAPSDEPVQDAEQADQTDDTADAPQPNVVETAPGAATQPTTVVQAPKVVDSQTGETVDVTASLRSGDPTVPDAPKPDDASQVSTTPAVRPIVKVETDNSETDNSEAAESEADAAEAGAQTEEDQTEATQTAQTELTPTIGTSGSDLKSLAPEIKVNRLPTLGDTTETETDAPQIEEAAPETDLTDAPAVQRFAVPFENPENKPLMSIVLMDEGAELDGSDVGVEALGQFPHPVTFAVNSSLPDAAERMKKYRDEGFEVMALIDLPSSFTAQDTEVSMGVILSDLPEIVGVLEGTGTGLQSGREVSAQVAAILAQTGHGLITQPKGLNTGLQLAERAGVPAKTVFRDLDSKNQTAIVIRRFLDQAAFKAAQEDGIVMLGRVRPETISALLLWGLQGRADSVAIAPASAVLTAED